MTTAKLPERSWIESLDPAQAAKIRKLSEADLARLRYDWPKWARPKQLPPPGDWSLCMWLTGRGWGKTRCGSEWVRLKIESGECKRMALVAPTAADARDVMVEGESGILAVCPPWSKPDYEPSKRRLTWPSGAIATTYSADEPERLRGPQHDGAWCDELAAWRYPEAWDMLMFGLRLGANPQCAITTTPKPRQLVRRILEDKGAVVIRGSTYENRENLAPAFFSQIVKVYEGTTLGRQELYGEVLADIPGALWQREAIVRGDPGPLQRIVVAIDPAVTSNEDSDETGIIVAGKLDDRFYVLDDLSGRYTPDGWARKAVGAYRAWKADRIIGEVNNGGDMIEATLRQIDANVSYKSVRASRGKAVRAEPIAALYEQGRAIHVGAFNELEDQMCSWTSDADWSPDRLDAMVWAATELMLGEERVALVGSVDL
jgi:phage terminase large subunit-like protein